MGRFFKKYCNKETCEGCSEMHYNIKAQRWCYDEKYNLKNPDQSERYCVNSKGYRVLTGVIESEFINSGSRFTQYEMNFVKVI